MVGEPSTQAYERTTRSPEAGRLKVKSSWTPTSVCESLALSNVNPDVDHPRWSQATERRIGEFRRRPTLPFNGYAEQVASLYGGMDLRKYF